MCLVNIMLMIYSCIKLIKQLLIYSTDQLKKHVASIILYTWTHM